MAVIGIAIQYAPSTLDAYTSWLLISHRPWQLLATAAKFLQVLSGFGVFLAPLT